MILLLRSSLCSSDASIISDCRAPRNTNAPKCRLSRPNNTPRRGNVGIAPRPTHGTRPSRRFSLLSAEWRTRKAPSGGTAVLLTIFPAGERTALPFYMPACGYASEPPSREIPSAMHAARPADSPLTRHTVHSGRAFSPSAAPPRAPPALPKIPSSARQSSTHTEKPRRFTPRSKHTASI